MRRVFSLRVMRGVFEQSLVPFPSTSRDHSLGRAAAWQGALAHSSSWKLNEAWPHGRSCSTHHVLAVASFIVPPVWRSRTLSRNRNARRKPCWTLRISSGVSKGIDKSVVQSGRDFPYIRVGGGQ